MSTIYPASESLLLWDRQALEAACVAQILYVNGRLDLSGFNPTEFDRRLGRSPDTPDIAKGGLRVLFEEGFEVHAVSPIDGRRVIESMDYLGEIWLQFGLGYEEVKTNLPKAYPRIRRQNEFKQVICSQFSSQWSQDFRPATWDDVVALVAQGYQVICDFYKGHGFSSCILIVRPLDTGGLEVFDPYQGVYELHEELPIVPAIEAFRLR